MQEIYQPGRSDSIPGYSSTSKNRHSLDSRAAPGSAFLLATGLQREDRPPSRLGRANTVQLHRGDRHSPPAGADNQTMRRFRWRNLRIKLRSAPDSAHRRSTGRLVCARPRARGVYNHGTLEKRLQGRDRVRTRTRTHRSNHRRRAGRPREPRVGILRQAHGHPQQPAGLGRGLSARLVRFG